MILFAGAFGRPGRRSTPGVAKGMSENRSDVLIVGAGILGLAHAYAAAKRGLKVTVLERGVRASGASVRNFGMIWPIGQPLGARYEFALQSRRLWLEALDRAGIPYARSGSLHLTYRADETEVAREFVELAPSRGVRCAWQTPAEILERCPAVVPLGLQGGIWSDVELTIDPRVVVAQFPAFLAEQFHVAFHYGTAAQAIGPSAVTAAGRTFLAEHVVVCSGDDFEALFPLAFHDSGLTRCKLQMMRSVPYGMPLGPSLAAGLTLRFYPSFQICSALPRLKARIAAEMPEYDRWGIHVMVSQTAAGELTIGDSHEYGLAIDIFDKTEIDDLILRYLATFLKTEPLSIASRWHGVYCKHPADPYIRLHPAPGVQIVTGPGGAGMTLSFAIGEETCASLQL